MPRIALPQPFEELDHTADAGVVVRGETPEETLGRLVLALGSLLSGGAPGACVEERALRVGGAERVYGAIDLLRELLYVFDTEALFPVHLDVEEFSSGATLDATVGLARHDPVDHAEGLVLKAVTLHGARFEPEGTGWVAAVVFDV